MLSERVTEWTKQWKQEGLEQGKKEGREEGRVEGSLEATRSHSRKMLEEGLTIDMISRVTGLSIEDVKVLRHSPSH